MNKTTKIAVTIGVALMIIISVIGVSLVKVKAEESVEQGVKETRYFEVSQTTINNGDVVDEYRSYKLTLDKNVYPVAFIYDNASDGHTYARLYLYDSGAISISSLSGGTYSRILSSDGEVIRKWEDISVTDYVPTSGDYVDPRGYPMPVFSGIPVYVLDSDTQELMRSTSNFDKVASMLSNGELEHYSGFEPWNDSNYYEYDSLVFDANLQAPDVRSVILSRDYGSRLNSDGSLYEWDNGYYYDIKFLLPEENVTPEMHTEIWVDVPVRRNSTGEIEYKKIFLSSYLTTDLWEKNIPKLVGVGNKFKGDDVNLEDTGYFYHIKENWSDTIGKYITPETASLYGGVTFYIRSAKYLGGTLSVVSTYSYFNLNPSDVSKSDTGIFRPAVVDVGKDLTENKSDVGTSGTDKPNDGNLDYIGGVIDTPPSNNGNGNNSGMIYIPSGEWNLATFSDWVKNGFGLLGSNGILAFIGNLFWWLPAEFFGLIAWAILVGVIIAVIKLVF